MKTICAGMAAGLLLTGWTAGTAADEKTASNAPAAETNVAAPVGIAKEVKMKEHQSGTWTPGLSEEEKRTLFAIAKDTLAWCVRGDKKPFPLESYQLTPKLKAVTATFVTLKIKGELRGCIGSLAPVEPLYQSVHHNAINAAQEDPRFRPVQAAELPRIAIDVSILSPIRDIASLDEFKLGQMGIILAKGMRRAVFLPEVAVEQGWTKEETLSSLSRKAGLPEDAWKKDARFQVFESVVISEE
jgi:AmmeMemoRadiSam system protein A